MEPERMIAQAAAQRAGWLRSAVFTANGGIMALGGLLAGVAATAVSVSEVLVAGVAGLVAGAIALASAQYGANLARTDGRLPPLATLPPRETFTDMDLPAIAAAYRGRGLSALLAEEAALAATFPAPVTRVPDTPRPIEAALGSATWFAAGAAVPVALAALFPIERMAWGVGIGSAVVATMLAALAARGSEASTLRVMGRVAAGVVAAVAGGHVAGTLLGSALG